MLRQTEVAENQILFHELYSPCRVNALGAHIGAFSSIVTAENPVACSNEIPAGIARIVTGIGIVAVCLG